MLFLLIISLFFFGIVAFIVAIACILKYSWNSKRRNDENKKRIGFFHPYCNAGGGGERVLWYMIKVLKESANPLIDSIDIYTTERNICKQKILANVEKRFGIALWESGDENELKINFVYLKRRFLIEASTYPRFTLIGQSVGSMLLACEAFSTATVLPNVFIDTTGFAFTFPIAKYLAGCEKICAYVHYPTISTDMLQMVSNRKQSYNNQNDISNSWVKSKIKLCYYQLFAYFYQKVGNCSDFIYVNSTWTFNHITGIWHNNKGKSQGDSKIELLYPPCETSSFMKYDVQSGSREDLIISLAQFRPEKNHLLQLKSFNKLCINNPNILEERPNLKLVLIGSVRDQDDVNRVSALQKYIEKYFTKVVGSRIEFQLNVPFEDLTQKYFTKASIGLHTMSNEHFGIGIVEMMAAGLIVIAHGSGGPKEDILKPLPEGDVGFLATSEDEYAKALIDILNTEDEQDIVEIRERSRIAANKFSNEVFQEHFKKSFFPNLNK